jgi:hypothetical protein
VRFCANKVRHTNNQAPANNHQIVHSRHQKKAVHFFVFRARAKAKKTRIKIQFNAP